MSDWVPQHQIDALVARCRIVVGRFGGQSDALADLRTCYKKFYDCPCDVSAAALDLSLKPLENEMRSLGLYPET